VQLRFRPQSRLRDARRAPSRMATGWLRLKTWTDWDLIQRDRRVTLSMLK